jgi:hypothetical protein
VITRHCRWRRRAARGEAGRRGPGRRQADSGPARHGMFFADAAEFYIEKCLAGKRTRVEIEQLIRGKLVPKIERCRLRRSRTMT